MEVAGAIRDIEMVWIMLCNLIVLNVHQVEHVALHVAASLVGSVQY